MNNKNLLNQSIKLGEFQGLNIYAKPSVFPAAILIWAVVSFLGLKVFKLKPATAVIGGIMALTIHFISEGWHQIGHAGMAEQTGHPMEGMEFWGPLASSKYPKNEGMLAADVHIQRALGGPIFSLAFALISGMIALVLRPIGGTALLLTYFTFLDNLLVFTIGALLPLGFTDGSTILHWWGHRRRGSQFLNLN